MPLHKMGKYISESVVCRDVYKQMWFGPARAPVVATEFKNRKTLTRKIRANIFCHVHVCVKNHTCLHTCMYLPIFYQIAT